MRFLKATALALTIAISVVTGVSAAWPERPVTVIVPFSAGGTTDVLARLVAEKLRAHFKVPFLIENRTGGSGNIGTQVAAQAPADGYTLVVGTISTHSLNPLLMKDAGFDPIKDFAAVSGLFDIPNILLVKASLGPTDVKGFIDQAKQNPGKIFFGTTGAGSSQFMAAQLFQARTGTKLKHVTFKGAGDIMTALLGGHLDMAFNSAVASMPLLSNPSVKVLGVTSAQRLPGLEQVPAISETIPGFQMGSWAGVFAPASTPPDIVQSLSDAVQTILNELETKAAAERLGSVTLPLPAAKFKDFVSSEQKKWADIVAQSDSQQ